jgi:hypothetical protein
MTMMTTTVMRNNDLLFWYLFVLLILRKVFVKYFLFLLKENGMGSYSIFKKVYFDGKFIYIFNSVVFKCIVMFSKRYLRYDMQIEYITYTSASKNTCMLLFLTIFDGIIFDQNKTVYI